MQLYIHRDGQQYGPYSLEEARDYLASGSLAPDDLAWHDGAADWIPLGSVTELAPAPQPEPALQRAAIPARRVSNGTTSAATAQGRPASTDTPSRVSTGSSPSREAAIASRTRRTTRRGGAAGYRDSRRQQRSRGIQNMIVGGVSCTAGLVITGVTYSMASSGPGGVYVIAWGAILFGGWRFFRGIIQMSGR